MSITKSNIVSEKQIPCGAYGGCFVGKKMKKNTGNHKNGIIHYRNAPSNVFACVDDMCHDNSEEEYVAYTDGSCDNINNPHAGGSAYVILKDGDIVRAKNKGLLNTTSNRAEMLAIVSATLYTPENSRLDIYTDSQYAMNIFSGKWAPKTNTDLVNQFKSHSRSLKMVVFHWVRGHNGNEYNEMVDDMARSAYKDIIDLHGIKEGKYARGGHK